MTEPATMAGGSPGDGLANAAHELLRARGALDEVLAAGEADGLRFYRLRDLALATLDFCRELLVSAGIPVEASPRSIREGMKRVAGGDQEVLDALETLFGLTNAHVLSFLPQPPHRRLQQGQEAGVVVAAFLDALTGDGYLPRR